MQKWCGEKNTHNVKRTQCHLRSSAIKKSYPLQNCFSEKLRINFRYMPQNNKNSDKKNRTQAREENRSDIRKYESWSREKLYEKAEEVGIEGRGSMDKDELIEALRDYL